MLERLLAEKHTLTNLNLASNALGKDGALSLSRALPYSHWLTHIDVRSNLIGEQVRVVLQFLPLSLSDMTQALSLSLTHSPVLLNALLSLCGAELQYVQL